MWITFNTHFCEAHLELTETIELTLKKFGYGQANLVEDIVSRLSEEFQHQANMVNSAPPDGPAQPITTVNAEILHQFIALNQELMQLLSTKDEESGRKNTNRSPTSSTRPWQGQPRHPMPAYFDK